MVTMHRRRQYRDRRARHPTTLEDLMQADLYIAIHIAITGFFFVLLMMLVMFGEQFLNLFTGP